MVIGTIGVFHKGITKTQPFDRLAGGFLGTPIESSCTGIKEQHDIRIHQRNGDALFHSAGRRSVSHAHIRSAAVVSPCVEESVDAEAVWDHFYLCDGTDDHHLF